MGSGEVISERREQPAFHGIEASGAMTLNVEVGPEVSVTVTGDDNLVSRVQTSVRDGVLRVRSARPAVGDAPLEVEITTPRLTHLGVSLAGNIEMTLEGKPLDELEVKVTGAGKLEIYGVDARDLSAKVSGTGKLVAHGNADELVFSLNGVGAGDFQGLCAKHADLTVNGTGRITAVVADELQADVNGAGSIGYYGDPMVSPEVTGTGRVRNLGEASWCDSVYHEEDGRPATGGESSSSATE